MDSLVSVIIPTYNRQALLKETVASVLEQTHRNVECLVVDDGSTDGTVKMISEWASKDKRLKLLSNIRNKGAQGARNTGLDQAAGDYIVFLDSDDLLHRQKIEMQLEALNAAPDLDMVYALDEYFSQQLGDHPILWNLPGNRADDIDRFLYDDVVFHTQSPLWRTVSLKKFQLQWDETIICWQDWLFHLTAMIRGIKYANINKVLGFIRDHDGERSTSYKVLAKEESKLKAASIVFNELDKNSKMNVNRAAYLSSFILSIMKNVAVALDYRQSWVFIRKAVKLLSSINKKPIWALNLQLQLLKWLFPKKVVTTGLRLVQECFQVKPFPDNSWKKINSIPYQVA